MLKYGSNKGPYVIEGEKQSLFSYREFLRSNMFYTSRTYKPISANIAFTVGGNHQSKAGTMYLTGDNNLSTFVSRYNEIKRYENVDLIETVVNMYKDYISGYIQKDAKLFSFKDDKYQKYEDKINKIFEKLNIIQEVEDNLYKIIFYGGYSFVIGWDDEERTWFKRHLLEPSFPISVYEKGVLINQLVMNEDGELVLIPPYRLLKFGGYDLSLINDMNPEEYLVSKADQLNILRDHQFIGAKPLLYGNVDKLKDYILSEKLMSLLGIRDLIMPLLLLVKVERNTSPEAANELALNIERLINGFTDTSMFLGDTFSAEELVNVLFRNIKVLPDFNQSVEGMTNLDITSFFNKVEKLRGEQDAKRDDILTSLGFPPELYRGGATKWEAAKTSERFSQKVNAIMVMIKSSIKRMAATMLYMTDKIKIPDDQIIVNIFSKTTIDYNNSIAQSETITNLLDNVRNLIEGVETFLSSTKLIDRSNYIDFVKAKLKDIDPDLDDLMTDEIVKNFLAIAPKDAGAAAPEFLQGMEGGGGALPLNEGMGAEGMAPELAGTEETLPGGEAGTATEAGGATAGGGATATT